MSKISKYILIVTITFASIGCDQKTKAIAKEELQFMSSIRYFNGLVQFQFAENEGGFLSIGSKLPFTVRKSLTLLLSLFTVIAFGVLVFSADKIKTTSVVSFSFLIAGASGNLIDRLFNQGRVIDFIILGTRNIHTGIFNVADVLLMVGTFMLFVTQLLHIKNAG